MTLCLIVAVAENGVIGRDNDLPWRLPGDLKRFKSVTMGKPLIMGRRTYDSIGRPLPGRANIVLTRDVDFHPDGVLAVHDPDAAIEVAEQEAERVGATEIMVIGGAGVYEIFLNRASRIYLTEIHDSPTGDTEFMPLDPAIWRETDRERHVAEGSDSSDYSFVVLDRLDA